VIDHRDLDQAGTDVQTDRGFRTTEHCHGEDRGADAPAGGSSEAGVTWNRGSCDDVFSWRRPANIRCKSGEVTVRPVTGTENTTNPGRW
jgi:hypothetical protein